MTVAYIDEVGLGSIFGELVACAAILPNNFYDYRIRDSKQLKHKEIYELAPQLKNRVIFSFGIITTDELNSIRNMYRANQLAMIRAVKNLPKRPSVLLIDGKIKIDLNIDCISIIKGDEKILGIATASIIAKDYRDHLMINKYGNEYQEYDIASNKGYRSPKHIKAIVNHGITKYHRSWIPQIKRILT